MPLGLRNAGATYQRLVDNTFHGKIGRNLEVYVDDLVIKSRTEDEVVCDIEETFKTLRKINMKLNPKKCTFGVEEGILLGYQVNTKGIKICPDKNQPSNNLLQNRSRVDAKGWSIQLGEFGIHYRPEEEGQDDSAKEEEPLPAHWTLFTDGSSCVDGCGKGRVHICFKISV
ncbi:reverse transcriptase domain-containing protein [Tanacetum coccineum]